MSHTIHRIESFQIVGPFTLQVRFEDGLEQQINFEPVLAGALYGPLRDPAMFNRVALDAEVHTLVWPNGADFDPETLHDWPTVAAAWIERARRWQAMSTEAPNQNQPRQVNAV
jgi:hypothetical protein